MFLEEPKARSVQLPESPFEQAELYLGRGNPALEVVVAQAQSRPRRTELLQCWKRRHGGRPAPVLLVVPWGEKVWTCGPTGIDPPVYQIALDQARRLCRVALLEQPNPHAAIRFLHTVLPRAESELPGVVNRGLLSEHVLKHRLPQEPYWEEAARQASAAARTSGEKLLHALGFELQDHDRHTLLLRAAGRQVAVAVLLRPEEAPDQALPRFNNFSPVSYAVVVANQQNVPYVLVVQHRTLRIYPAEIGLGVGQRGRTETFLELHLDLVPENRLGYLWAIFSAPALQKDGYLAQLLKHSQRFAGDLARKFRERIYNEVIPRLAQAVAQARHGRRRPSQNSLAETYQVVLTILFRLLFIAYAEDKDLLPWEWNQSYRQRSLKRMAEELAEKVRRQQGGLGQVDLLPWEDTDALWEQVLRLFRCVEEGYPDWGVPIYNGRLFSSRPEVSQVGPHIARLKLSDRQLGPVLCHLLLTGTEQGVGPVDFASLSVREFGTIYEGLLESELSWAEQPLVVDQRTGAYRPLTPREQKRNLEPDVPQGRIYLHNRSGARKSTGSYYTKPFAVEYLLDQALEPALQQHLHRLEQLPDDQAAEALFDFRVADIAMGSGHFLVAAVDRIERTFSNYLNQRPLPQVEKELTKLRLAALDELEKVGLAQALGPRIENNQLLRRLVARRCIYGVDLNPLAVDLARLSLWIHTFVPGLPLSFLDHNLVAGNSLTGVGTLEEVAQQLQHRPMFLNPRKILGQAQKPLLRLARLADATPQDLRQAQAAHQEARRRTQPAQALCDLVAAARLEPELQSQLEELLYQPWEQIQKTLWQSRLHRRARRVLQPLEPLHFPVAFPEVFLRPRAGFDCILGNPPWKKPRVEQHAFWARYEPGLRGLNQREQERLKRRLRNERPDLVRLYEQELQTAEQLRRALVAGPYPGMGTGDPDLYKAFCWRFWHLVHPQGGHIGVVLPRSAWSVQGSKAFRETVFEQANTVRITTLVNNRHWVFDDGHPQWTYALTSIERGESKGKSAAQVLLQGPYATPGAFERGRRRSPARFAAPEVLTWTNSAALPLLPTEQSLEIFARMRKHPRLDQNESNSWRVRPHRELDSTNDKRLMSMKKQPGFWPVYKGESFELWEPDRGPDHYYAWADPEVVLEHLQQKRLRGGRNRRSAFSEFEPAWLQNRKTLPCLHPRIAFRDVTRATDTRTLRAALVPPKVFLVDMAPYLLWPRGDTHDVAYLLGILGSLLLDWYARRVVETHVKFHVLNPFPVPRPSREHPLWQRVVRLAGRLAAVDRRFRGWASRLGVDCGRLDEATWYDMLCQLDAAVALLYGLEEKHLRHVFETFHEGWEPGTVANHPTLGSYDARLEQTLEHFRRLRCSGS